MQIHFGNDEYKYLVGKTLLSSDNVCRVIQEIRYSPDSRYHLTDGYAGNAYCISLMVAGSDEIESLHFRHFIEVVKKYGELYPEKPKSLLTIKLPKQSPKKWDKIYPEE
jgi:hypothetical protein